MIARKLAENSIYLGGCLLIALWMPNLALLANGNRNCAFDQFGLPDLAMLRAFGRIHSHEHRRTFNFDRYFGRKFAMASRAFNRVYHSLNHLRANATVKREQ
jgi:hypothetical protein